MTEGVIIAIISAGIPSVATIVTTLLQNRLSKKHAARNSILQLITEDHLSVMEGGLPENYQSVLHEYDEYKKNGGNSYVEEKVSAYKEWYKKQEKHLES